MFGNPTGKVATHETGVLFAIIKLGHSFQLLPPLFLRSTAVTGERATDKAENGCCLDCLVGRARLHPSARLWWRAGAMAVGLVWIVLETSTHVSQKRNLTYIED